MSKMHTLAVFIGRFQPFHIGHMDVVDSALAQADSLLVLVGSSYRPRSWQNPFTYNERVAFIRKLDRWRGKANRDIAACGYFVQRPRVDN